MNFPLKVFWRAVLIWSPILGPRIVQNPLPYMQKAMVYSCHDRLDTINPYLDPAKHLQQPSRASLSLEVCKFYNAKGKSLSNLARASPGGRRLGSLPSLTVRCSNPKGFLQQWAGQRRSQQQGGNRRSPATGHKPSTEHHPPVWPWIQWPALPLASANRLQLLRPKEDWVYRNSHFYSEGGTRFWCWWWCEWGRRGTPRHRGRYKATGPCGEFRPGAWVTKAQLTWIFQQHPAANDH